MFSTRFVIIIYALIEGMLVMACELISGAIIIPFYGNSLTVWTFVLGITMACLAMGYYLGSILVNKSLGHLKIYNCIGIAVLFFYFMPEIAFTFFKASIHDSLYYSIFIGVFPMLVFPLLFLGVSSTLIVNSMQQEGNSSGVSSGFIYGVSTMAGIFSALIIGLFALENINLETLLYFISILVLAFILIIPSNTNFIRGKAAILIILAVISFSFTFKNYGEIIQDMPDSKTLYKSTGILGEVKVVEDLTTHTKLLFVNNALQSTLGVDGMASLPYVKYISYFLSYQNRLNDDLLLAGVGGGNLIKDLLPLGFNIDVVELDPRIIDVSSRFFMVDYTKTNVFINDARHYINTTNKKYDVIILDLSIGEAIPSNVYTKEAFKKQFELLKSDGILVLHLFSIEGGKSMKSIYSIGKTMESSGFNVYLFNNDHDKMLPSPYIFVASKNKIDFNLLNYNHYGMKGNRIFPSPEGDIRNMDYKNGEILVDDKPLLDIFQQEVVLFFRKNYIKDYFRFQ